MVEFRTTKKGNKTYSKMVNGQKISVYEINGKFSIRINDEHVVYVSEEEVDGKVREYCQKLHYADVPKLIEFEKNNNSKGGRHFSITTADNNVHMSIHIDGEAYLPMVKATDRLTGEKKTRQIASRVYDFNEAITICQDKKEEYDAFGYFTRHDMIVKKNCGFVEEKLKEEKIIETDCYMCINGNEIILTQEQAEKIVLMIEHEVI